MGRSYWVLLATYVTAAAANVCNSYPYSLILPFSSYAPAESFCSSHYPVAPVTTTVNAAPTVTSTSTTVTTSTVTSTTSTSTVVSVAFTTQTVGATTTTLTSTVTGAASIHTTATSSITLALAKVRRDVAATSWSKVSINLCSIQATISTACSCIEKPATKTVTASSGSSTVTVTRTVTSTSIVNVGAIKTTTSVSTSTVSMTPTSTTVASTTLTTTVIITDSTVFTTVTTVYPPGEGPSTSSSSAAPTCTNGNIKPGGTYGCTYQQECNTATSFTGSGGHAIDNTATSQQACFLACDNDVACYAAQWNFAAKDCTLWDSTGGEAGSMYLVQSDGIVNSIQFYNAPCGKSNS